MEKIYTIPVNEAFEASLEDHVCPFCRLHDKLEEEELDLILGASMMEPDVRIKTNEQGFCDKHLSMMFTRGKRLPLALILESHLAHIHDGMSFGMFAAKDAAAAAKKLKSVSDGCYICGRTEHNFDMMVETAALLWQTDPAFRDKTDGQHHFCLSHFVKFLEAAEARLSKKELAEFYKTVGKKEADYIASLNEDVSRFCRSFDYRYADEPLGDAKDAPERTKEFLK